MRRWIFIAAWALSAFGCGGKSSPTAPTSTTPITPPAPTLYAVTGTIASVATGQGIANATARVEGGPNVGLTAATDATGRYSLSGLTLSLACASSASIQATARISSFTSTAGGSSTNSWARPGDRSDTKVSSSRTAEELSKS